MNIKNLGVCLLLSLMTACSTYTAKPLDLKRDTDQWLTFSRELCAPGRALSPAELRHIGLLLNPALNKARLTFNKSSNAATFAGLWEDPTLSADAQRVLKENFYNGGITPGLTIPVTGLPALARKVAEQYKEADYWTMYATERDFLAQVDQLRYTIMITHAKLDIMSARLRQLEAEKRQISTLHELGEVSFAEYQVVCQRLNDTIKEKQEMESEHLERHQELVSLLGLHPSVRELELQSTLPGSIPAAVALPTEEQLLSDPALKALMASYGASEQELRAEIRRQYPELSISPMWAHEDRNNKIGMGIELSLPLWNRNREAIANATGEREIRHHDTVQKWRSLLQQASALSDRQALALNHCRTEQERLQTLRSAGERQQKLFAIGESTLPALAEARHEVYQRHLNYLDCLAVLLDIQVQIQYLNPFFKA